ncbi:hypothetical protein E3N88_26538 [Mikania micrantha]|uniref:Uncharacterized protein n=1 Tax=Mikania micrantha TaxID=192012 RepID=A0A5N6MV56_9ASTR|nr:hypothetical protein E3N88_26538 [Mikania micrantha]
MSNDLRSWFVTFPNGMIPLVENWGCDNRLSDGISATKTNTFRKKEVTLRKQHCFRRITYSYRKVYKTTASEGSTLSRFKASEDLVLLKNKSFRRHSSADQDFLKYSLIKDCS